MSRPEGRSFVGALVHGVLVVTGAAGLTLSFFLVLPLIQAIHAGPRTDLVVQTVDTANVPPPPPPPEDEPEPEEEPEEEPPELEEDVQPLDLAQLELALNPGFGDGWLAGDFAVKLNTAVAGDEVDDLFTMSALDQPARAVYKASPVYNAKIRKKAPGTVWVIFMVDREGRVQNPKVEKSTDPVFDGPALAALKKWKFEPRRRKGEPIASRMRIPITFSED